MKRKLLSLMLVLALAVSLVPAARAKALTGDQDEDWGKIVRDIKTKTVEGYECVTITDKYSKKGLTYGQWTEHRILTVTVKKGESIYLNDLFYFLEEEVQKLVSSGIYKKTNNHNTYAEGVGDYKYLTPTEDSKRYTIVTGKKTGFETFVDDLEYYVPSAGIYVCPAVKVIVADKKEGLLYADEENYLQFVDGSKGKKVKLADASGKVTYKSSNKKVFKVSKKGNITPVAPGYATLTAKAGNKTYTATVCVISKGLEYGYDIISNNGVPAVVKGIGKCKDKKIVIGRYAEDNAHMIFGLYKDAFNNTSITDIALPDTLRELNTSFVGTKIKKLNIPAKVTKFGGTGETREAEYVGTMISADVTRSYHSANYYGDITQVENSGPLTFSIKDVTINSVETFNALCNSKYLLNGCARTYHFDGKDFVAFNYLSQYTPEFLGFKDDSKLISSQDPYYTALKAVDFNPAKDTYNARALKANLIIASILNQVSYCASENGDASKGRVLSKTVTELLRDSNGKAHEEGQPIKRFACDNYCYTTVDIYKAFGLPADYAFGYMYGEPHAWAIAFFSDGKWHNIDNVSAGMGIIAPHFDDAVKEIGIDNLRQYVKNIKAYGGRFSNPDYTDLFPELTEMGNQLNDEEFLDMLKRFVGDCDIELSENQCKVLKKTTGLDYKIWLRVTEEGSIY